MLLSLATNFLVRAIQVNDLGDEHVAAMFTLDLGKTQGVIEEAALADLLVIDGNPIDDIELVARPDKNFMIIMKDGKIFKNTLPA
jgi:imidazolonepropionase-like amidohydrolase